MEQKFQSYSSLKGARRAAVPYCTVSTCDIIEVRDEPGARLLSKVGELVGVLMRRPFENFSTSIELLQPARDQLSQPVFAVSPHVPPPPPQCSPVARSLCFKVSGERARTNLLELQRTRAKYLLVS